MHSKKIGLVTLFAFTLFLGLASGPTTNAGTFQAPDAGDANRIRAEIRAAQFLSRATFGPTMQDIKDLGLRIQQIGYLQACEDWIDQQFAMPIGQSDQHPSGLTQSQLALEMVARNGHALDAMGVGLPTYRYEAWWHIAVTSDDQLRQRVAWALSQIFAVGNSGMGFDNVNIYTIRNNGGQSIPLWLGMSNFYDMLTANAFGTYRELLGNVTYHPIMGVWLSSAGNQKALKQNGQVIQFPDENYAREVQQLFSIGLYQLHKDGRLQQDTNGDLIPTYDNDGIAEMARVFTGLHYADGDNTDNDFNIANGRRSFGVPMAVNGSRHDNNRDYNDQANPPQRKTIFLNTPHAQAITLPANYNSLTSEQKNNAAKADIDAALEIIAGHPNVAPFISRLLIQRLVKANPSRAYISRVSAAWDNSAGDLKAVIKAILLDPELLRGQSTARFRNADNSYRIEVRTLGTEYSRLREPINRATALIRAMEPTATERKSLPADSPFTPSPYFVLNQLEADFGQFPYRTPTVFNFYLPDYQTPELANYVPSRRLPLSNLTTPEFEILNASTAISTSDRFKNWCRPRWTQATINHAEDLESPARRVYRMNFNLDDEIAAAADDSTPGDDYDDPTHNKGKMKDLLQYFDLLLCNGSLGEDTKRIIYEGLATTVGDGPNMAIQRVEGMVLAIVTSPDCAVED